MMPACACVTCCFVAAATKAGSCYIPARAGMNVTSLGTLKAVLLLQTAKTLAVRSLNLLTLLPYGALT